VLSRPFWLSLGVKPDVLRPPDKLIQIKKFASKIFPYIAPHNSFEDL
jgi:hypothetical protein